MIEALIQNSWQNVYVRRLFDEYISFILFAAYLNYKRIEYIKIRNKFRHFR